jgi:L-amino acid N-acyltransferase YncA
MVGNETDHVRPLTPGDFERVVAIDSKRSGSRRESFYAKRLKAASEKPHDFIYVGIDVDGALEGFAIAQLLRGEFGDRGTVAVLDAIGVDPDHAHGGLGQSLMDGLIAVMQRQDVHELRTEVDWRNHELLHFLAANGFEMAPRLVLERDATVPVAL